MVYWPPKWLSNYTKKTLKWSLETNWELKSKIFCPVGKDG